MPQCKSCGHGLVKRFRQFRDKKGKKHKIVEWVHKKWGTIVCLDVRSDGQCRCDNPESNEVKRNG